MHPRRMRKIVRKLLRTMEPVQEKDKADETPETKTDPFDPESYKNPDEVIAEHVRNIQKPRTNRVPHSSLSIIRSTAIESKEKASSWAGNDQWYSCG